MHVVPNYNYLQKNNIFIHNYFFNIFIFYMNPEVAIYYRSKVNKNCYKNSVILFISIVGILLTTKFYD